MPLTEYAVQVLEKFSEEEAPSIKTPTDLPPSSADVESLFHNMRRLYAGKSGKAYGGLLMHGEQSSLAPMIKDWYEGRSSFLRLTQTGVDLLKDCLAPIPVVTQSYCFWAHEQQGDLRTLYLFIVESSVTQVLSPELQIEPVEHLNPQELSFGIRIELSKLFEEKNLTDSVSVYLQKAQRKVAEAACQSLGFSTQVDRRQQTEIVLAGIERYADQMDQNSANQLKKRAVEYCQDQEQSGEPVTLTGLSSSMDENQPERFASFVKAELPDTPESLRPESRKLKQLVRFSGRGNGLSLSFSSDVFNNSIMYDDSKDALVITDIPKSLKAQLKRFLEQGGDNSEHQQGNSQADSSET